MAIIGTPKIERGQCWLQQDHRFITKLDRQHQRIDMLESLNWLSMSDISLLITRPLPPVRAVNSEKNMLDLKPVLWFLSGMEYFHAELKNVVFGNLCEFQRYNNVVVDVFPNP